MPTPPTPWRSDGTGERPPIRRVAVVTDGDNPSFDYYFASRQEIGALPPLVRFDLRDGRRGLEDDAWDETFVIFCRYVSVAWLTALRAHPPAGVGLFLDDDLEALAAARTTRWRYRRKLQRFALRRWPALRPLLDRVWISTPTIAARWADLAPVLLSPVAGRFDLSSTPDPSARPLIGLHQSGSHTADQMWLEPVVRAVLAAGKDVEFEVVADLWTERRWRGDPRIRVVPFRSWPDYRADTARRGRDLLLAPLAPTAVNAARAEVKRIDAVRCGAALMVSDPAIYHVSAEEAALGMQAPFDQRAWVRGLIALIDAPAKRHALAALNRTAVEAARREVPALFEPVGGGIETTWRLA